MIKKGIAYYPSTSIKDDDGYDIINDIIKADKGTDEEEEEKKPKQPSLLDLDPKPKEKRKKRSKFKEISRLFIFDDLSSEVRSSSSLKRLLKLNRHLLCKTIISSQWVNDLDPQSINQLDYTFLFKAHNDEKLAEIHRKLDLSIDLETFKDIYKMVTGDKTKFNFLYIDRFEEYRQNFNKLIMLEEQ